MKLSHRTLILIGANVVLVLFLVLQIITGRPDSIKKIDLEDKPDQIEILLPGKDDIVLKLKNETWFVGEQLYPANNDKVDSLISKVSALTVLETVGGKTDDKRYDLTDDLKKVILLKKEGTLIRTLVLGKESTTTSQTFARLDDNKDILLISGSFNREVDTTEDALRNKVIYSLNENDVVSLEITGEQSFQVVKNAESGEWELSGDDIPEDGKTPDQEKIGSWVRSLLNLNADTYPLPEPEISGEPLGRLMINTAKDRIGVSVYEKGEDDYLCKADNNPSPFTLADWSGEKIFKKIEDFYPDEEK